MSEHLPSVKDAGEKCEEALLAAKKRNAEFQYFHMHTPNTQQVLEAYWKSGWLDGYICGLKTGREYIETARKKIEGVEKDPT